MGCCLPGLLCDLLWSDPEKEINGWGENDRGVSFTFGQDVVHNFLRKHDLDLVCRAHQVATHTHLSHTLLSHTCVYVCVCALGCRGRLRVLREAPAGDAVQRPQLLRRVRQRRRHDVRRRDTHVLFPGMLVPTYTTHTHGRIDNEWRAGLPVLWVNVVLAGVCCLVLVYQILKPVEKKKIR